MIIEFSIENFLSIKNKMTLSLEATADKSMSENLISINNNILKSALIYGPNASGKSNILAGFLYFINLIKFSHKNTLGDGLNRNYFKFMKSYENKPSKFNIIFIYDDVKYDYFFSIDNSKIIEESLFYYPNNKKAKIFSREGTNKFDFTIDKNKQKELAAQTLDNTLYLSRATQLNYELTKKPFEWFKNKIKFIGKEDEMLDWQLTGKKIMKDPKIKPKIIDFLKSADLGIEDIKIEKNVYDDFPADMPDSLREMLMDRYMKISFGHNINNKLKYLEFGEESEGTKKLFSLSGALISSLENGSILIIDELESSLHPFITEFIIKIFHSKQNKNNAQLLFTTHNLELLRTTPDRLFRRDQIWFTSKDKNLSTNLYPLTDFRERKDLDLRKAYIQGRFGALPFIDENL